jgi:hypothetical protein
MKIELGLLCEAFVTMSKRTVKTYLFNQLIYQFACVFLEP